MKKKSLRFSPLYCDAHSEPTKKCTPTLNNTSLATWRLFDGAVVASTSTLVRAPPCIIKAQRYYFGRSLPIVSIWISQTWLAIEWRGNGRKRLDGKRRGYFGVQGTEVYCHTWWLFSRYASGIRFIGGTLRRWKKSECEGAEKKKVEIFFESDRKHSGLRNPSSQLLVTANSYVWIWPCLKWSL